MTDDGLESALARLMSDGTLDAEQARRVHTAVGPLIAEARADQEPNNSGERVVEVLAYVGGALVIAAVGVIAALMWDELGRAGQIAGCLAAAAALLGAAFLLGGDTRRRHTLRGVLAALAAAAAGLSGSVIARALADDDLAETATLGAALGVLAVAVPAYLLWRGPALVAAWFAGGWLIVLHTLATTGSGWDDARPLIFFGAYGVVVWAIGWLVPEREVTLSLALATVAFGAAAVSFDDSTAWWALAVGLVVVIASFALFVQWRYAGLATVGALTALFVPAFAVSSISGNAVVVASVLSGVGLALIAGAIVYNRRS
jgi:hypothetical protein